METIEDTYIVAEKGYKYYVLASVDDVVGMYRPSLTEGKFVNKAYLTLGMGKLDIYDEETNTDEGEVS